MTHQSAPQTDLYDWVCDLLQSTGDGSISIDLAISKTRARFPGLSVSDEDLTRFIAGRAAERGLGVEFDHLR